MREFNDRAILIGDVSEINPSHVKGFVETTGFLCKGDYPEVSVESRVERMMKECQKLSQDGVIQLLIIDSNPRAMVRVMESIRNNIPPLNITVVGLDSDYPFDHVDEATGIRMISLPPTISPFPMHPTPDS